MREYRIRRVWEARDKVVLLTGVRTMAERFNRESVGKSPGLKRIF